MKATTLNHAHPSKMEARYIEEVRKMSPQQRYEKLMAIIEISYLLKTAKKYQNNSMNSQIIEIWKYFSLNKVKYLTIGGFAVNIYGYGRNTGDIDIFIEDSVENRENLRLALKQSGIGDFENLNTIQFIPGWTDITLNFNLRLDIMTSVKGLENKTFEELLEKAYITEISDIPLFYRL